MLYPQSPDNVLVNICTTEEHVCVCVCAYVCNSLGASHVNQPPAAQLPFTLLFICCCWGLGRLIRVHHSPSPPFSRSLRLTHTHTCIHKHTHTGRLVAVPSSSVKFIKAMCQQDNIQRHVVWSRNLVTGNVGANRFHFAVNASQVQSTKSGYKSVYLEDVLLQWSMFMPQMLQLIGIVG